jgi:hypothetical protein
MLTQEGDQTLSDEERRSFLSSLLNNCHMMIKPFKSALESQVQINQEPFFSNLVKNKSLNTFMYLKKKSHILIEKSCVLIGVPDPTGLLEAGEIFCQVSPHNASKSAKDPKRKQTEEAEEAEAVEREPC